MRVSVVIPVFNKAPFLRECLTSVLTQEYTDLELIAVDDASTDGSLEILKEQQDHRLRLIELPRNVGPAGAMQRAIDAARGEYIVRLDADDIMMPHRIEMQVAHMDQHPELIASGGQVILFGNSEHGWWFPLNDAECRAEILFGQPVCQGTAIFRRSMLMQSGIRYLDEWPRVGEDWLFWASLAPFGKYGNLPVPLIRCRRGSTNSTAGMSKVQKFEPMVARLLTILGLRADQQAVNMHLLLLRAFKETPLWADIGRLREWMGELEEWNRSRAFTNPEIFHARIMHQWDKLFHHLADHGVSAALGHMQKDRKELMPKIKYLVSVFFSRSLRGLVQRNAPA